jgi:hypothetical protein
VTINFLIAGVEDMNEKANIRTFDVPKLKSDLARRIDRAACFLEAKAVELELSQRNKTLQFIDAPSISGR